MPEFHAEPYLHLAGLSNSSALVTWGAFYFRTRTNKTWKLVDDDDLRYVHPLRRESIGARSAPYGPARVNVYDASGALAAVHVSRRTHRRSDRHFSMKSSKNCLRSDSDIAAGIILRFESRPLTMERE